MARTNVTRPAQARRPDAALVLHERRVFFENIRPAVDGGAFPLKRVVGEPLEVSADALRDGHARLSAALLYRKRGELRWREAPMQSVGDDRWTARCVFSEPGLHEFAIEGWADSDRARSTVSRPFEVVVDPERALSGAWYEMFPRSQGRAPGRSATFKEAAARLSDIAAMGFDVVYLAPIHPIGRTNRKGPDNSLAAADGHPGSPWAIGAAEGGHKAVHPDLGTLEDFRAFVREARRLGMEVALDLALQCSPDHPYIRQHPDWFKWRPDGTIAYAENPPKKYEDIVPFDFDTENWRGLWDEMKSIVLFWIGQGVTIFRVDNPHTKPFGFWQWLIAEVKAEHPETIFLAEAFTRPKPMRLLAKLGFDQSYTYFTWRHTKDEFIQYLTELTRTEQAEYFRPNFFCNTPDILPPILQFGGRPAFKQRLVLAATLAPSWGIYSGFELCEASAVPGTEDYLHSEKYEYKVRDWNRPGNIKDFIARVNRIRAEREPLRRFRNLRFLGADATDILFYEKRGEQDILLVAVNLDPYRVHDSFVHVPFRDYGLGPDEPYVVEDLLTGARYSWKGETNYVRLDPGVEPAHILRLERTGR